MSEYKINYKKLQILTEYGTKTPPKYPLVVSVPHSGQVFPQEFFSMTNLTDFDLRHNEDLFVDELVRDISKIGVPVLSMNISRAFIDVNRDVVELDPKMFFDYPENKIAIENNRCRYGLGLIHRINAENRPIYRHPLSYKEVQERIKNVYNVYHKRLSQLISASLKSFGYCFVLDCHSMPSKICSIMGDDSSIQFCLGDLFSQSCPKTYTDFFKNALEAENYSVSENIPYSGAYITFNYCQPRQKVHTLQLEINRELYADEKKLKKNDNFQTLKENLAEIFSLFAKKTLDF